MSTPTRFFTLAELRRDTDQARQFAPQALISATRDAGHQLIWSLFAGDPAARRDFLFRDTGDGRFLIVSARAPIGAASVWHLQTNAYAPVLAVDQRFGFALRINPTISLSQPNRARSRRVDVLVQARALAGQPLTPEQRQDHVLNWLAPKLARSGAVLEPALSGVMHYTRIHPSRGGAASAALAVVDVEGVLTVADPALLQRALFDGLGAGKAFGLGLLLLRPLAVPG